MIQVRDRLLSDDNLKPCEFIDETKLMDHEKAKIYFEQKLVSLTLRKWKHDEDKKIRKGKTLPFEP